LEKNTTGTFIMLKVAFGEHTGGKTQVREWLSKSKSSIISVEEEQFGCPLLDKQHRRLCGFCEVTCPQKQKNQYP
jgi:hypothetical protein